MFKLEEGTLFNIECQGQSGTGTDCSRSLYDGDCSGKAGRGRGRPPIPPLCPHLCTQICKFVHFHFWEGIVVNEGQELLLMTSLHSSSRYAFAGEGLMKYKYDIQSWYGGAQCLLPPRLCSRAVDLLRLLTLLNFNDVQADSSLD